MTDLTQDEIKLKAFTASLQSPPSSKEELKDWIFVYLGLDMPDSHLEGEDSNGSPMEAVWIAYDNFRLNKGDEAPGYIWLSARDAMKTLGASILAVVLMVFFGVTICWLASIEPQSKIALGNVQNFMTKIKPMLTASGRSIESNNARNLEIVSKDGKRSLVNILVATMASVNGRHVNVVMTDEVDLLKDRRVLDEVQAVASLIGGQFPLKVYFSTRKFAFGNMEDVINNKDKLGLKLIKWDILDVTEACPASRHKPEEPMVDLYVPKEPPLHHFNQEEFDRISDIEQKKLDKITVHAGCAGCKLVSQCRGRLAKRPEKDRGLLWKKIDHTINMFRSMSPDMAVAQLLCRKPSQSGLVYPRFEITQNTLTLDQAYYNFTGEQVAGTTIDGLVEMLKKNDIQFYVGGDWGSTAAQAFVVSAIMPGGDWWIIDSYAIPGLEFDEVLSLGIKIRDKYSPKAWYMDTNQPMFIKAFNKNGMICKDFKKDVLGGIECVRTQIINSMGLRKLRVIKHERTEIVLEGFKKHHFNLDSLGKPTDDPDDGKPWSDVMDSIRYLGQNLFGNKGSKVSFATSADPNAPKTVIKDTSSAAAVNKELMQDRINSLTQGSDTNNTKKKGSFRWNI